MASAEVHVPLLKPQESAVMEEIQGELATQSVGDVLAKRSNDAEGGVVVLNVWDGHFEYGELSPPMKEVSALYVEMNPTFLLF